MLSYFTFIVFLSNFFNYILLRNFYKYLCYIIYYTFIRLRGSNCSNFVNKSKTMLLCLLLL